VRVRVLVRVFVLYYIAFSVVALILSILFAFHTLSFFCIEKVASVIGIDWLFFKFHILSQINIATEIIILHWQAYRCSYIELVHIRFMRVSFRLSVLVGHCLSLYNCIVSPLNYLPWYLQTCIFSIFCCIKDTLIEVFIPSCENI
jgi:hypothetical protein